MSDENQRQADDTDDNRGPDSATAPLIGQDSPNQEPTENQTRKSADKTNRFRAFLTNILQGYKARQFWSDPRTWIEAGALITVVFYTVFAHQQVATMNDTLAQIKEQTGYARTSSEEAIKSARAAQEALAMARENFRKDERPYIALNPVGTQGRAQIVPSGEHAGHLSMEFQLTNYGKSPGVETARDARIAIGEGAARRISLHEPSATLTRIIPPNDKPAIFAYSDDPVTPQIFDDIAAGRTIAIIYGHIEYTDLLLSEPQSTYLTEFCVPIVLATNAYQAEHYANYCRGHTRME